MPNPLNRVGLGRALAVAALAALVADGLYSRARFRLPLVTGPRDGRGAAGLHNAAALVARGADLKQLCGEVAESAAAPLGGEVALVLRFEEHGRAKLVGRWVRDIRNCPESGEEFVFEPSSAIGTVLTTGRTARVAAGTPSAFQAQLSERVATPIEMDGRVWGAMAVAGVVDKGLPSDAETRIERFAELVALAIANSDARAQLVAQATLYSMTAGVLSPAAPPGAHTLTVGAHGVRVVG